MLKTLLRVACVAWIPTLSIASEEDRVDCYLEYLSGNYGEAISSCSNALNTPGGNQVSGYLLGEIYSKQESQVTDEGLALHYYTISAKSGYPPAQLVLGHYYADGVRLDLALSACWYMKASQSNWDGAVYSLSRASDIFFRMGRAADAYKLLFASNMVGDTHLERSDKFEITKSEKEKAESEVLTWLGVRSYLLVSDVCKNQE